MLRLKRLVNPGRFRIGLGSGTLHGEIIAQASCPDDFAPGGRKFQLFHRDRFIGKECMPGNN